MTRKNTTKVEETVQMTQEAYDSLENELNNRKEVIRKEIADEIASARELGDLSENHAYTVAMEKKDMNENRISEIENILVNVDIIVEKTGDNKVGMGEKVEIQNTVTHEKRIVFLVGSEVTQAANPEEGAISTSSPIGKAILNAKVGEIVSVELPNKVVAYKILRLI